MKPISPFGLGLMFFVFLPLNILAQTSPEISLPPPPLTKNPGYVPELVSYLMYVLGILDKAASS